MSIKIIKIHLNKYDVYICSFSFYMRILYMYDMYDPRL